MHLKIDHLREETLLRKDKAYLISKTGSSTNLLSDHRQVIYLLSVDFILHEAKQLGIITTFIAMKFHNAVFKKIKPLSSSSHL